MLCKVCREGLDGIWDPTKSKRLGKLRDFPEILRLQFRDIEDDDFDDILGKFEVKDPEHYVFGHHADYESLLRSKQQGCVACKDFGESNDEDDVSETFARLGFYSVFCINLSRTDMHQPTMFVYSGEPMEEFFHEFIVHDESDFVNSVSSSSTSDTKTWALVETWLDTCLSTHEACQTQALEDFSPTRLLEVSKVNDEDTFRLVVRDEYDLSERYVTLSHCWGSAPAHTKLRLLKSTECILRDSLPVSILPKTFQDGFEIAQRLGVRYIWIDRLCIVQDSAEDWEAEAAVMQTVYRNGFINIAALGANDDMDGCFFDRDPLLTGPAIINLSPEDDLSSHYRHPDESEAWKSAFVGEPLLTRAWVLQERMLAARNLYFGRQQVFWECCITTCCETIPTGPLLSYLTRAKVGQAVTGLKTKNFAWKSLIGTSSVIRPPGGDSLSNLLGEWSKTVETYCACSLTFSTDKLIALSGLAIDMRSRLKELGPGYDGYIAGMWKVAMPASLLWTVKGPSCRPPPYRAPSWCWASVDGAITHPTSGSKAHNCLVSVLDVETLHAGSDVTGLVLGGRIELEGPLCTVKGIRPSKMRSVQYNLHRIATFHHPDTGAPFEFEFDIPEIRFDTTSDECGEVTILIFWSSVHAGLPKVSFLGLALVRDERRQTSYRRVGIVSLILYVDGEVSGIEYSKEFLEQCPVKAVELV